MTGHNEHLDGVGVTGKLLAGFPSITVDLGTGMLAQMGVKQRIALRQPIPTSRHSAQGDERMLVTLTACQNKPVTAARPDYSFQPAITIDIMDERMGESFRASAITDARAHEHGYATADDMRKSLRLNQGEDPVLFSYGMRVANPVDMVTEDSNKAGTRLVARRDAAYRVWNDLPNERTVQWARNYLETLPEAQKFQAIALITPREKLTDELLPYAPGGAFDRNHKGKRVLPQEVAALNGLPEEARPAPATTPPPPPLTQRPKGKLKGGEGWTLISAAKPPKETAGQTPPPQAQEKPAPTVIKAQGRRLERLTRKSALNNAERQDDRAEGSPDDRLTTSQHVAIQPKPDAMPKKRPRWRNRGTQDDLNSTPSR